MWLTGKDGRVANVVGHVHSDLSKLKSYKGKICLRIKGLLFADFYIIAKSLKHIRGPIMFIFFISVF